MGINPDRLLGDLAELSTIGGRADGGVDRVAWGAADLQGRQWLKGKLEAAGWHAFTDPALNVFGRASDVRRRRLLLEIADAQRASEHLQDVAGFIELHIEQGPRLEAEHAPVAVVSGILGFDRYRIDIGGRAGHGGTTPFELRHDPVQAAAAFVAEVPSIVRRIDDAGTATVGSLSTEGGAINFVAPNAWLTLEVRQPSTGTLAQAV